MSFLFLFISYQQVQGDNFSFPTSIALIVDGDVKKKPQ